MASDDREFKLTRLSKTRRLYIQVHLINALIVHL